MSSPSDVLAEEHRHRIHHMPLSSPSGNHYANNHYNEYMHSFDEAQDTTHTASNAFTANFQSFFDNFSTSSSSAPRHQDPTSVADQAWMWSTSGEGNDAQQWPFDSKNAGASVAHVTGSPVLLSDTEVSQSRSASSRMIPSLSNTTGSLSPNNEPQSQLSPHTSIEKDDQSEESEYDDDDEEEEDEDEGEDEDEDEEIDCAVNRRGEVQGKKVQRRQGVTCDQCRSKHIRCVAQKASKDGQSRCDRCREKNLECTRNYAPPSRRYPRPSRTGKRIEQARMMHGTLSGQGSVSPSSRTRLSPEMLLQARPKLFASTPTADAAITNRVMAGSVSLRLLTCFFATAHMQMPIVDFHNFSARYNFSQGDCRTMSLMANGGDPTKGIPPAKQSAPGLSSSFWPPEAKSKASQISTLSTPGSCEALVAVLHAWAALYTDMPMAFGGHSSLLLTELTSDRSDVEYKPEMAPADHQGNGSGTGTGTPSNEYVMGANGKLRRPKRKQGVACDTCRLRRLRCDKLERPDGMGCSRCEDKRIICTDDYIQSKRKKTGSQNQGSKGKPDNDEGEKSQGVVGSAPAFARDVGMSMLAGPFLQQDKMSVEQKSWIEQGLQIPGAYRFGKSREALAFGKARQPFFKALLERAISLVVKHQLMVQPSVEGIQALMLLAQITDLARKREGDIFAEAAANHISTLGLESNYEVDERDQKAVEQILGHMQRRRLWCCVWTRDAIVSGLYRKPPRFVAERAFGIRGSRSAPDADIRSATAPKQSMHSQTSTSLHTQTGVEGDTRASAELNGEMGLSFSILALMQVGALSRFMAKHVDNVTLSVEYGNADLSACIEMRTMTKACQALWKSIDSLLLFFDQCSLKARTNMDQLQPFQPLGWIATIKIAGAMLDLATFRNLAERLQRARLVMHMTAEQQHRHPIHELKELLKESKTRTLASCRRIAKLVEFLLGKNVFQTSGIILRQLLPVTHFLAKMPCAFPSSDFYQHPHHFTAAEGEAAAAFSSTEARYPAEGQHHVVDPRTISRGEHSPSGLFEAQTGQDGEELKQGHIPESIFSHSLEPFDALQKKKEVSNCLEALAQMGYAWPTMDAEIAYVERIMAEQSL